MFVRPHAERNTFPDLFPHFSRRCESRPNRRTRRSETFLVKTFHTCPLATGETTTWATPAPTFDRRDTDLWETRKTCSLLSSLVFLLPSIGQLIHLEARRGVRAERGSIDQEVHLPFVCVVYLRLCVRALSCAFVPAQEFRPKCFSGSREAAVAFCLSRPFFAFSPPGTLGALHFFLIFFLSPAFIYFQSSQPPNSSPNPFARPSPFTLLPTPASNLPHLSFRRSAPPTSASHLPKAGKREGEDDSSMALPNPPSACLSVTPN